MNLLDTAAPAETAVSSGLLPSPSLALRASAAAALQASNSSRDCISPLTKSSCPELGRGPSERKDQFRRGKVVLRRCRVSPSPPRQHPILLVPPARAALLFRLRKWVVSTAGFCLALLAQLRGGAHGWGRLMCTLLGVCSYGGPAADLRVTYSQCGARFDY